MQSPKLLLISLALVITINLSAQDTAKQPAEEASAKKSRTCTVQGLVVAAATGIPLKSAWITLTAVPIKGTTDTVTGLQKLIVASAFTEVTDANGHFVITGVPGGEFELRGGKTGYVSQDYLPDGGRANTIKIEAGEKVENVQFRLTRAAVIVGRITDESGEPASGVEVDVVTAGVRMGDWSLKDPGRLTVTNDLGEYRIFGLTPGAYYLSATDSGFGDLMSAVKLEEARGERQRSHPPIYYPGVTSISNAQKIRVSAGQESRIDFALRMEKLVTVSGQVRGPDGKPAAQARVTLAPREPSPNLILSSLASVSTDAKGSFVFKEVLPSSYAVAATLSYVATNSNGNQEYWAEERIDAGANISGLILELSKPLTLSGRVSAVAGSKFDFHGLDITLEAEYGSSNPRGAEIQKDGKFAIDEVRPSRHRLIVYPLPDGWYVRSAFFGKQNVLEDGLQLSHADTDQLLEITLSPGAAQVEGVVRQGDVPVHGALVRLFPERARYQARWFQEMSTDSGETDADGHFTIKNVVPGQYRILAYRDETEDDGFPPEEGAAITLVEKESRTVQLRLEKRQE